MASVEFSPGGVSGGSTQMCLRETPTARGLRALVHGLFNVCAGIGGGMCSWRADPHRFSLKGVAGSAPDVWRYVTQLT